MSKPLTRNSKLILADMIRARRPLSVRSIASRNNVAWKTASNNIKALKTRGLVSCKVSKRRTYCMPSNNVKKSFRF